LVFYLPSLRDAYKKFSYAKTASHHHSFSFGSLPSQPLPLSSSSFATFGVQSSFVQVASFLSPSFWGSCLSFGFHWLVRFRLSIWSPFAFCTPFLGGVFSPSPFGEGWGEAIKKAPSLGLHFV
jgi:hypothetical protein